MPCLPGPPLDPAAVAAAKATQEKDAASTKSKLPKK